MSRSSKIMWDDAEPTQDLTNTDKKHTTVPTQSISDTKDIKTPPGKYDKEPTSDVRASHVVAPKFELCSNNGMLVSPTLSAQDNVFEEEPISDDSMPDLQVREHFAESEEAYAIEFPANIMVCGRTNTGKTSFLSGLMMRACYEEQFDQILVMLGAVDKKSDDYSFVRPQCIFTEPSIEIVEAIMQRQKEQNGKIRTCLILDDVMGVLNMKKGTKGKNEISPFQQIAAFSRKYNLSLIIVVQSVSNVVAPWLRDCMNSIFSSRVMPGDIDFMYKCSNCFEKPAHFRNFNNQVEPYEFMRINRAAGGRPFFIFKSIIASKWFFKDNLKY